MKRVITDTETEAIDKVWQQERKLIEGFLMKRGATISEQYGKELTEAQFKRLQQEEEFVSTIANFMNDCECFVAVHRKHIKDLEYTIQAMQRGHVIDTHIIQDIQNENNTLTAILQEMFDRKENKALTEIMTKLYQKSK